MPAARFQVLLAALCFATTGTAQALGPDGIPPIDVGAARIVVGGALLALAGRLVRDGSMRRWPRGVVAAAAAGGAAHPLPLFAAAHRTRVAGGAIGAPGPGPGA